MQRATINAAYRADISGDLKRSNIEPLTPEENAVVLAAWKRLDMDRREQQMYDDDHAVVLAAWKLFDMDRREQQMYDDDHAVVLAAWKLFDMDRREQQMYDDDHAVNRLLRDIASADCHGCGFKFLTKGMDDRCPKCGSVNWVFQVK